MKFPDGFIGVMNMILHGIEQAWTAERTAEFAVGDQGAARATSIRMGRWSE